MIKKRKIFSLQRALIAQARRIYWFYFRPKALIYHRKEDKTWDCKGCMVNIKESKNAKVDHIQPVVDTEVSSQSWDVYYNRLFIEPQATQILCQPCHGSKTRLENQRRKSQ